MMVDGSEARDRADRACDQGKEGNIHRFILAGTMAIMLVVDATTMVSG
jgi:hypothetical protein